MSEETPTPYARPAYRWYVLGILTLVYTFNFVDRQILVILQEQIRVELDLMDWQLGILSGFAFAIFYAVLGMPIAHLSETVGRKRVIAVALTIWSGMTALSGTAQNFVHLLLFRIGVGVGEAGGSPPAHSIISDIFPRRRRAFALAIYSMGIYFGIMVGFGIGGWIAEDFGWRTTFVVVGLPGVLLAVIVALTIKEPPRGMAEREARGDDATTAGQADEGPPGFRDTLMLLWSRKSFRHVSLACSLHALVSYGVGNFVPSFLIRAHDMSIGDIGWRLAIIAGVCGAGGVVIAGWLGDRLARRDQRWYAFVPALSLVLTLPLTLVVYTTADTQFWFYVYAPYYFLTACYLGPSIAIVHSLVGLRQRAVASAVLFFVLNLIGLGLGPLVVGVLSDLMRADYGDADALRYAIIGVALVANAWSILHYLLATRTLNADIAAAVSQPETP